MKILRLLLFPFSLIYGSITSIRNFLFDIGILKPYSFQVPVIVVGNLSVGGTGKTPQIEYLIRLLSDKYKVATLSRGYKRKSKGFLLATDADNATTLGDEPFQYFKKYKNIDVAVDADRKNGIEQLLIQSTPPEVILLDDAMQHRRVAAGLTILLTSYDDLFYKDFMLPTGNLREGRMGATRASIIIVTKCPNNLSDDQKKSITNLILKNTKPKNGKNIPVFFSSIAYSDCVYNNQETKKVSEIISLKKVLIAGIAKPKPFFEYLQQDADEVIIFPDHHQFNDSDINKIKKLSENNLIITTEKDYVRLQNSNLVPSLFYLPIQSIFKKNGQEFDAIIQEYVEKTIQKYKRA